MTYRIPDALTNLRTWLRKQGATEFATERQCAFMAQQLAGTRFKFPPKGQSCFPLMQQIERSLPTLGGATSEQGPSAGRSPRSRGSGKSPWPKREAPSVRGDSRFDKTPPTGLVIYADGACEPNPGAGGWGFVVYRDGIEIHCESGGADPTTNNVMELTGALMALRWFAERGVIEPVRLFCDSMYVVNGCNDWRHGWKKKGWRRGVEKELANADLWRELDEALTLVPIKLEWCRGHVGILGNERADELSLIGREAALQFEADPLAMIREQLGEAF